MRSRRRAAAVMAAGQAAAMATLCVTRRVGARGTCAGAVACGVVDWAVIRGLRRHGRQVPTPADWITWSRAGCAGVLLGFAADGHERFAASRIPAVLACLALATDRLDGVVARRACCDDTAFGRTFDGEADALLIAALSIPARHTVGWWVLPAGFARYAFGAAGMVAPWLARPLPPRYARKVAAAIEGITVTLAILPGIPRAVRVVGQLAGSTLIAESFGRDVLWLWNNRTRR